jgi:4a-hydroxytetrahydrobiopterin dehydratase
MNNWKEVDNQLTATFRFKDFVQAFAFMTEVAFEAEKQQHHPNWDNVWNTVNFYLNTHDAGDIVTAKDHTLAKAISAIAARYV